jgi:hypothetical protein
MQNAMQSEDVIHLHYLSIIERSETSQNSETPKLSSLAVPVLDYDPFVVARMVTGDYV